MFLTLQAFEQYHLRLTQLANSFNGCSVFENLRLHVLKFKYLGHEGITRFSSLIRMPSARWYRQHHYSNRSLRMQAMTMIHIYRLPPLEEVHAYHYIQANTHQQQHKQHNHSLCTQRDTNQGWSVCYTVPLHSRLFVPLTLACYTRLVSIMFLIIMIWNQSIVQYRMPIRPFASTRNRSRHPSTAVRYPLIGVSDKLLNPSKLPCLLSFFTSKNSFISVAVFCFDLLAESFTLVTIDDRFPDEWND